MPELPEVETTRKGILPYLEGAGVVRLTVSNGRLRWPVPGELPSLVEGQVVQAVDRRAKYLQIRFERGTLLVHLGMSGSLRLARPETPRGKHDHIEMLMDNGWCLRYCDPRRFGAWLWSEGEHPLLARLGPEPLGDEFDGEYLWRVSRGRKLAVKPFIMDNAVVVGVGNIYATEALFLSGIRPDLPAGRIAKTRYIALADTIRQVLQRAIAQGGTTLRDFVSGVGEPGYFQQQLHAYGRKGKPCNSCGTGMREVKLGQRSTVFCPVCQR